MGLYTENVSNQFKALDFEVNFTKPLIVTKSNQVPEKYEPPEPEPEEP